ncbi:putative Phosphatidylglycerol/phosphatidylinositol transfer protein [Hyaloscypha variabilis F]|uniref:Phosphatidylglycerol/phosphatidylinositol transfer protein n=1 Tax=Hyaloscypha variabilis (strain UAMH 11265 / GT02V1 / F) TaxID=1149755 RepID=A0A2J6S988_HYAVF|nr:putative Phosphatidylglycerol/phosphatidylinositol transfer protein [Hyaloscypha variabilis F]
MKFSISLIALLLSSLVASEGLSFSFGGQKPLGDGEAVPGNNPLTYCQAEHGDDILILDHVNLTPNPPQAGETLTIEAVGTLLEEVDKGAYVILQVKFGLIRLVNTQADLCTQVSNVDLECPIEKGKITITKDVEIPKEIPSGTYTVFADVYTKEKKKIVCLEATVLFGGSSKFDL